MNGDTNTEEENDISEIIDEASTTTPTSSPESDSSQATTTEEGIEVENEIIPSLNIESEEVILIEELENSSATSTPE